MHHFSQVSRPSALVKSVYNQFKSWETAVSMLLKVMMLGLGLKARQVWPWHWGLKPWPWDSRPWDSLWLQALAS